MYVNFCFKLNIDRLRLGHFILSNFVFNYHIVIVHWHMWCRFVCTFGIICNLYIMKKVLCM